MKKSRVYALLIYFALLVACKGEEILPEQEVNVTETITEGEWERVALTQSKSKDIISLKKGKCFEKLSVVGKDFSDYCNLEENMRGGKYIGEYRVLFCKDPIYDITYYVNYGQDYFIYALKNGVSELVLEIPASELYCKDGELYFMAESYNLYEFEGMKQGNILKYNPKDGIVEIVIDENVFDMIVYQDGICYEVQELIEKTENGWKSSYQRFYYSFEKQETETYDSFGRLLERWKKEWMVVTEEGIYLSDWTGDNVRLLKNLETMPDFYWIKGDSMYYLKDDLLVSYHFDVMEEEVIAELGVPNLYGDFVIQNGIVYFGELLRVSLEDGVQYYATIENRAMGPEYTMNALYTDGERLYCVNGNRMWLFSEERTESNEYESQRVKGRPIIYNGYVYQLRLLETQKY